MICIYFCVNLVNFSHVTPERSVRGLSVCTSLIAMATNFNVKIGDIRLFTFIRRPGIRKQIAISHFGF